MTPVPLDLVIKAITTIAGPATPMIKNKLERSEAVIKLLKQFNLDPEHPPADFTGVYQYALVEYGVGKPQAILELFRQPEIQKAFRQAFEQVNFSILLKAGESFLDEQPRSNEIHDLGLDPKREFIAFATIFMEVAKRTRTPAQVLTNQQISSLHRNLAIVLERIERLPTLEGLRTEMARLSAQNNLSLPAATDSEAQQCRAFALAQQMRGWFETLGYRFEKYEVWEDDYFEWIINIPVRRGRYDRILVRGMEGEAGIRDVMALRQSVEVQHTDEGWLVTTRRISRAARDEMDKEHNSHLGCYTFDELLDQDADFSGYLNWLEAEIQRRQIEQKYVPLACTKEEVDPVTQQRLAVSRYDERDGWIDGYIDQWLDDPAKEHISILGEFGTGKTWFALHYAWKTLQRYREAQRRGLERPRLPLVIPLRDYAKAVSVESLFSEFFFRKHEIPLPGYSAFEQLNRMGKLLLIFDGFDEMAAKVDRQQMINNFWELAKVVVPGAKVILTCRTEHFPDAKEGRSLLNAELQASTASLTGETPQFEVLELEKFNDEQIRQVLSLQARPEVVEQVVNNAQLVDLARRPVMTELILEALPEIEAGKPVDMSRVYLYAVRRKMERDIKAERTFTSLADKLYFLCELSWEMLSTDQMSLNYRLFPDRIRRLFGNVVQEEKDLDHWHYDMMGQTMLIRNADGDYTPAHRSLLEFFVAYKFAAELGALAPDFLELAREQSYLDTNTVAKDYGWSDYFSNELNEVGQLTSISPLRSFTQESLEVLKSTFGKALLTKAVIDLLVPMLVPHNYVSEHPLLAAIIATRNKTQIEVGYVGGNATTLLMEIDRTALEKQDLSKTVIRGANLTNACLRDTDFNKADLDSSNFVENFSNALSIAFSPDGKLFATANTNGEFRLWKVLDKQIFVCKEHSDWVRAVTFSPDGTNIATGSSDQTAKLWDVQSGRCLITLEGHSRSVQSVTFNSKGTLIATGSSDRTVKVWNSQSGECVKTLEGHGGSIQSVVFHPESDLIASCSNDQTVKLWDIQSGECIKTLKAHGSSVNSVTFNANGTIIVTGGRDQTIKLWDVRSGECIRTLEGHTNSVRSVAITPDSKLLATGSSDQTIKLWDVQSGECIRTLEGHTGSVGCVTISPNGQTLGTCGEDQTIRFWNIHTGNCIKTMQGCTSGVHSLAITEDGLTLVGGCDDHTLKIWNTKSQERPKILHGHTNWVESVAISPNKGIIASSSADRTVKLWNIETGACLKTLKGHSSWIRSVSISQNNILASGDGDGIIKLWDVCTGRNLKDMRGHTRYITSTAFLSDGISLVSSSGDTTIRLWNVQTGENIKTLQGHNGQIWTIAVNPSTMHLASGGSDCTIRLWNLENGLCTKTLEGHTNQIESVAFSPDGLLLVSGSLDGKIKIWDVFSGGCLRTWQGHKERIYSVLFGSDGAVIASGSLDETVKLWNVQTGECMNTFKSDKPYAGMNITGVQGLSEVEKVNLRALGAIEY
ncbi:MAG: NACHT domain-containing protein [Leptolyngbyaceae cyanobacterium bins.302]|nr:NACHT domain-containing protein [Leptolyngbyaceae cyanobacterium bins.302]